MVSDCGPDAEDETMLKLLRNKKIYYSCERPGERPCMVGHKRCYKITDTCVYVLSHTIFQFLVEMGHIFKFALTLNVI